ncbi:MAG: HD domain-containing protein [Firmicutes bacterium]|nr:HD domain-containing protein [Bacillota bacterium]
MLNKIPRIKNIEMLWDIANLLHTTYDLDQLLDMALNQAMSVSNAEAGTLWLNDNKTNQYIYPVIAKGPKSDGLKGLKLKIGEGMAGWVTENSKPQLISDVRNDPRWAKRFDQSTGFITKSLLCVPLATHSACIGCLQLVNKHNGDLFNEDDLHLCQALAGIIAIAVENSRLYTNLQTMFKSFLVTLSSALDARDPYTRGHSERVSKYSLKIGNAIGLPNEELEILERAALLHDIGKIGIRDNILLKESPLNDDEFVLMKTHPAIGNKILQDIMPAHLMEQISQCAAYHHERYDGKGYPYGTKGNDTPLLSRIIAVADTFDAMTTDRPYRKGLPEQTALDELKRCAGTQFDPQLVEVFISEMRKGNKQ